MMKKVFIVGLIILIIIVVWLFVPKTIQDKNNIQSIPSEIPSLVVSPNPIVRATKLFSPTPLLPPKPTPLQIKSVLFNVPFIVQAPRHNWKDPVYQNACEEAVILMAMRWVQGKPLTNDEAFTEIQKISDYSEAHYGFYLDQSAEDLARLMRDYFQYQNVRYQTNIQVIDIVSELQKGNLVLVPANGQKLGNPYFTPPGPTEHMLLIKGFDAKTKEFITNDPGIGKGNGYRYKEDVLYNAIRKYPSGYKEKIIKVEKAVIVVEKNKNNL